jgi:aldose 1-epimerase
MHVVPSIPFTVSICDYTNKEEEKIYRVILRNKEISVELTNIGCAITAIHTPDKRQNYANIVAGFPDLLQYKVNNDYYGCIVGRFANRIANGRFQLNGITYQLAQNNGSNHLHGGKEGFSRKLWNIESVFETNDECGVVFNYLSPDGEEGYPGNLNVSVKYALNGENKLSILYEAVTDQSTPISLTNHSYFNLSGFTDSVIYDHCLCINADQYTVKLPGNTPSGEIASVAGTALDFRCPKPIGRDIDAFPSDMGFDHNFIIKTDGDNTIKKAGVLSDEKTGRKLTVYTSCPAMQVYTSNYWDGTITGAQGVAYRKHGAVALETQYFPDSPNHSNFPDTILCSGETYRSSTIYEFGVEQE